MGVATHLKTGLIRFMLSASCIAPACAQQADQIWYEEPATDWDHALPVGNGRLGAMVFGQPISERIQLNEDSMWPGGPQWGDSKGTPEDLHEIRKLILAGKVHLADSLIVERFSNKAVTRSHQTLGDLYIDLDSAQVSDYYRSLNLDSAYVRSSYLLNGHRVQQTVFVSHPDQVLVVHYKTEDPEGLNLRLRINRPEDRGHPTARTEVWEDRLVMNGEVTQYGGARYSEPFPIDHGVRFEAVLLPRIRGGSIEKGPDGIRLKQVREATLLLVSATSYYHENYKKANYEVLSAIGELDYEQLMARHVKDYRSLYDRVRLDLGPDGPDSLSTQARLTRVKAGNPDLGLQEQLFRFGRYLLISSSRPGTNPANLQGIWNEHIEAPWNADYHLNINLQMNYWPAGPANLVECQLPLLDFADRLVERGKATAREQYGMSGTVIHHATDLWAPAWMRAAQPYWGSWIHGGGWLSRHYWEHYAYSGDTVFLRERAYPALTEFSRFYLDWLAEDPQGNGLISFPETSPENSYVAADGVSAAVSKGAAMGYQIIQDVFGNTLRAVQVLGEDSELTRRIEAAKEDLPDGLAVGPDGRLLEWDRPYAEPEPGHRHISHLYALHPDDAITEDQPRLFRAAERTIAHRLDNGGAGPGWSRAWIINFYARLLQGNTAYEHVKLFLERSIYPNLMDVHPPFQIDGNFGYTAGVAEMLLQSHEGFLRLLPALPEAWANGSVSGLKARGNITVDLYWKDGRLNRVTLESPVETRVALKYGTLLKEYSLVAGEPLSLNGELNTKD